MELHRFFVEPDAITEEGIRVDGEEFYHMTVVLRHKVGYKVIISCDSDIDYYCTIVTIRHDCAILRLDKIQKNEAETKKNVTLIIAISKTDKIELICQKAVELGVKKIIPIITEYSEKVVRMDRLSKIMIDAAKQCKRSKKCCLESAINLNEVVVNLGKYDCSVFCNEREEDNSIKKLSASFVNKENIAIIVGSEGGFSEAERTAIINGGAHSVSLGSRILRMETAAIVGIALMMHELGEM